MFVFFVSAWFPGSATLSQPYISWPRPLSEPCLRYSRTRLPTRSIYRESEHPDLDPRFRWRKPLHPKPFAVPLRAAVVGEAEKVKGSWSLPYFPLFPYFLNPLHILHIKTVECHDDKGMGDGSLSDQPGDVRKGLDDHFNVLAFVLILLPCGIDISGEIGVAEIVLTSRVGVYGAERDQLFIPVTCLFQQFPAGRLFG